MKVHVKTLAARTYFNNGGPLTTPQDDSPQEEAGQKEMITTRSVPTADLEMCDECNESAAVTICEGFRGTRSACGKRLCRRCVYRGSSMCQDCAVESRRAGGVVAAAVSLGYGHDILQSKDSPVKVSMLQACQDEQHQQDHDSDLEVEREGGAEEPSSEDEEYNLAAIYARNSHGQEAAGSYYVGPESMVDQEIKDEENYNFRGVDDDDEYDLNRYFDDEPGAVLVDAKIIEHSIGEDKDGWMSATAEEINQIDKKNVNTETQIIASP